MKNFLLRPFPFRLSRQRGIPVHDDGVGLTGRPTERDKSPYSRFDLTP
jgi:hypothetical protein